MWVGKEGLQSLSSVILLANPVAEPWVVGADWKLNNPSKFCTNPFKLFETHIWLQSFPTCLHMVSGAGCPRPDGRETP